MKSSVFAPDTSGSDIYAELGMRIASITVRQISRPGVRMSFRVVPASFTAPLGSSGAW